MAKRPTFGKSPDPPLNGEELEKLRKNIAHLGPHNLRVMYEQIYQECRLPSEGLPSPQAIQQLVQVWKQLRLITTRR